MWSGRNRQQEKQWRARDESERPQRLTASVADDVLRRLLHRVDSEYSRERLHDSWARTLQQMYSKAGVPESQWWTQYMRMATVRIAH